MYFSFIQISINMGEALQNFNIWLNIEFLRFIAGNENAHRLIWDQEKEEGLANVK